LRFTYPLVFIRLTREFHDLCSSHS
jgi:hypothetical protein